MDIAVGIINWNSGHWLKNCIESLLATTQVAEIVVVDNASEDRSLDDARACGKSVKWVLNASNLGFAGGVNRAFSETVSPFVLILNPDVGVLPGAIGRLQQFLEAHPKTAAIGGDVGGNYGPRKLPTVNSLVRENLGMSAIPPASAANVPFAVEQPAAAALMIRRIAYEEVGGFDARFYPAWYEDVDFCRKLVDAGWQIHFDPTARFEHEGGYSAAALGTAAFATAYYRNQIRYVRKHMSGPAGIAVRCSIVTGMIARAVTAPAKAGAYWTVIVGALGKW